MKVELVSIGHLSHDIIIIDNKAFEALGGSSAYVSAISSKLGVQTGLVTKVGKDFKKSYLGLLREIDVNLDGFKVVNGKTTSFKNIYLKKKRVQFLTALCERIYSKDIPEHYFNAKAFHIGPIYHDVSYDVLEELYNRNAVIAIDIQGYCRRKGSNGLIKMVAWREAGKVLKFTKIFKSSLEEAITITSERDLLKVCKTIEKYGPEIILITMGEKGSILHFENALYFIPAVSVRVTDPTGAGDVFIGAFLLKYLESRNPLKSAIFASSAASFIVEDVGFRNLPTYEMIYERMITSGLIDKIKQL